WGLALVPTVEVRPRLVSPARTLALLLLVFAAVAFCVAVNRGLALWGLLDLVVGVGLFLATARFARDPRDVSLLLRATLVAAALVFIGRPEGWMAGLAALILVVLARVVQVAGHGGRWSDLAPDPGGASLRALLIAGIVISAAVSVSRLTLLYPTHKPVEPLAGTALLTPTTGNPAADRASAIPGTLALIKRHPLGVGPANFRHAFLEVAWTEVPGSPFSLSHQAVHAGNAFLEMTAEAGVPGGLALVFLVLVVLIQVLLVTARAVAPWDGVGAA